ncbi:MAG: Asp23/Gls24 family envelope stress response protein [Actinobacteria bacterium HGW-Actinobacteria-1]|jgi:uncharacterized alkaline shock family protein YloU|nr:MAG: Asp23/Gls24 family envelope stress response protein [Actinobacteria bacterium HGW-Actinobacteria-1]
MSDEIMLEGLGVAPGVLETIATLAAQQVQGVEDVLTRGVAGLVQKGPGRGIVVSVGEDGTFSVQLHLAVKYGTPLRTVATDVQRAVSDALLTQTGQQASAVDVFIDSIVFPEQ